ncbi:hypothetical protein [Neoroseomonas terrae]|uniref:hypothetical protein n=1 Tax=Neoroseomonas terrae TaxID=424799 RepID=UPI001BABB674|nr:hypothetical protein [Neoroseomonas terrae]
MDSSLIATTLNRDLLAQGVGGQLALQHWEQLTQYLRRALTPEHAALFAEPNPDPEKGSIDWYSPGSGPAVAMTDLDPATQEAVRGRLMPMVGEIQAAAEALRGSASEGDRFLGELLRLALEIPDPSAIRVRDGVPVLAPWGHALAGPGGVRELLVKMMPVPVAPMTIVGPPAAAAAARARIWPWLLAFLAALLILLLALWLLWRDPFGWFATPQAQCVAPEQEIGRLDVLREEEAREGALRAELARIVAEAGERRLLCRPPEPPPRPPEPPRPPDPPPPQPPAQPPQQPPPQQPPQPPPEQPRNNDLDRADRQGARRGRTQVILGWDDRNDLDLAVICPNGQRIDYRNRSACGGSLDIDRNAAGGPTTRTPVENVVFDQNPAPGRYRIVVDYFDRVDGPSTPYRVTVRQQGQPDRVITGTARQGMRDQVVGEFTVP